MGETYYYYYFRFVCVCVCGGQVGASENLKERQIVPLIEMATDFSVARQGIRGPRASAVFEAFPGEVSASASM